MINEPVVQAKTEGGTTKTSQRDIVAGDIDFFESIVFLEVAKAVLLLFAAAKV